MFLFTAVELTGIGIWNQNRIVLNQLIDRLNEWTRAGKPKDTKELVLAEIDLARRALTQAGNAGEWYFETLDTFVAYVRDGVIPYDHD